MIVKDRGWSRGWVVFVVAPRGAVHFIRVLQVTVAGETPLSIHCERDEGDDGEGKRQGQEEGVVESGRSKVDLIL